MYLTSLSVQSMRLIDFNKKQILLIIFNCFESQVTTEAYLGLSHERVCFRKKLTAKNHQLFSQIGLRKMFRSVLNMSPEIIFISFRQKQSSRGVLWKGVLKNFAQSWGRNLLRSIFFNKVAGLRSAFMFSCELCKIFMSASFYRTSLVATSV